MNRKTGTRGQGSHCPYLRVPSMLGQREMKAGRVNENRRLRKLPAWLIWSLATIVLWGTWGLVSKIASAGVDAYVNQLLYTAGLAPLLIFVAWTVHRQSAKDWRERRVAGVS